jgi:hypothetical protein
LSRALGSVSEAKAEAPRGMPARAGRRPWLRLALLCLVMVGSLAIPYGWHHVATAPYVGLTGDEPHYLMITHSLATDRDLDLTNDYGGDASDAWYPDLDADEHVFDYRGDGQQISVHTPGLPVLLLPGYLLMENPVRAARATMLLVTALTLIQFYLLCRQITGSTGVALAAWLIVATSVPLLYLAGQVYPDIPAALAILLGVQAVRRAPSRRWGALLTAILWGLPFLHVRYVPLAVVLGLAWALRLRGQWRTLLVWSGLWTLGIAAFAAFYLWSFGNPLVNAQYAHLSSAPADWSRVPGIVLGLFWEREVGIVPVAPWLVLAMAAAPAALLHRDRAMVLPVALIVTCVLVLALALAAGVADWGWSLPWRFMLPVYPLLALAAAWGVARCAPVRWAALPLLAAGLLVLALSIRWPTGFYWRNAGVLAMPVLDRVQGLLPSQEFSELRQVAATSGVTTTHKRSYGEPPGPVCAREPRSQEGFLSWGIRKGMLPGTMRVTFWLRGEGPAEGSLGQVRVLDERSGEPLYAQDVGAADLSPSDWSPVSFDVASDRARTLMVVVTYSGSGELCLDRVTYEQTAVRGPQMGEPLAVGATLLLVAAGTAWGLHGRRTESSGTSRD